MHQRSMREINKEMRWAENKTHVENDIRPEGLLAQTGRCDALNDFTTIVHQARENPQHPLRPKPSA